MRRQVEPGALSPAIRRGLVVLVMLVALRDGRQSARSAQDVVEGAILRRARPSQRARRQSRVGRCGGGAGSGRGERKGRRQSDSQISHPAESSLERELERRREGALSATKFRLSAVTNELVIAKIASNSSY